MGDYAIRETVNSATKNKKYFKSLYHGFLAVLDLVVLLFNFPKIKNSQTAILYIHPSFIKNASQNQTENFYEGIKPKNNYIYFSYDKYIYLKNIEGIKVYNIGIVVKLFSKLKAHKKLSLQNDFNIWYPIQNFICKRLNKNTVYIPAYSNGAGLSLVFNKYRENFKLVEVQHGSVLNYPPYSFVSNLPLIDAFYYRTEIDKCFLKDNLFAKQTVEFLQIPQEQITFLPKTNRIEILYVSSYEFNDFHPVFKKFINNVAQNVFIRVRLHPRQSNLEAVFSKQLETNNVSFEIHQYSNWHENLPSNTIVISPFSSVIEEAVKLKLTTFIIDKSGFKRFEHLLNFDYVFKCLNIQESILKLENTI